MACVNSSAWKKVSEAELLVMVKCLARGNRKTFSKNSGDLEIARELQKRNLMGECSTIQDREHRTFIVTVPGQLAIIKILGLIATWEWDELSNGSHSETYTRQLDSLKELTQQADVLNAQIAKRMAMLAHTIKECRTRAE